MNEYFKSFLCDDSEKSEEQMRDHLVIKEEVIKILVGNDGRVKRFCKDGRHPTRKQLPFGEW